MNEKQSLEMLDSMLWLYSSKGLSACIAQSFLLNQFYGQKDKEKYFISHISNTFPYSALEAVLDKSIIDTYEHITEVKKPYNLKLEILNCDKLKCLRLKRAHSSKIEWRDDDMKKYIAEKKNYRENAVSVLFNVRQSVLEYASYIGIATKYPNKAELYGGLIETTFYALRYTTKPKYTIKFDDFSVKLKDFFNKANEELLTLYTSEKCEKGNTK